MHQVVSNVKSCDESVPWTGEGMPILEGTSDSLSRRNKIWRKRSGLLSGMRSLSKRSLNHWDDEGGKGSNCSLSSSNTLSCDESVSSKSPTLTRKESILCHKSTQGLQRSHRLDKLSRSCGSLSSDGKNMNTAHGSNHNAAWSVNHDSSGPDRLRTLGSESLTSRSPKTKTKGIGCSLSSSSTLSCDESVSSKSQTLTRKESINDDLCHKSTQGLQRSHRENLCRSCGSLSSDERHINSVHGSNHNAAWLDDHDWSGPDRLQRMKSNSLLNAAVPNRRGSLGSENLTSRSPETGTKGIGRSLLLIKSLSKRELRSSNNECIANDANEVEEMHEDEPTMGIEEMAQNIRQLIEENEEEVQKCTRPINLQLELAWARHLSGNTCGALIAMKKMKRIQAEQKKYMTAIDYLRAEEINITLLQERKDCNTMDLISLLQRASKEVEVILSVYEHDVCWTNEALLDELMSCNQ